MKAIIYKQYGGIERLHISEVAKPIPKDDEVLIKVQAVSLNDWDFGLLAGDFVNRILNGFFKPKRKILGSDIAGRVEAVGKNVKNFKTGDDVYGDLSGRWGGFAEYCCANEKALIIKPAGMSYAEAAAIPQAAELAIQGLIDSGKIRKGQKVLINGAGGGVGTFGVQIAKLFDVEITGVDSESKLDMMRSLGFDHVIDYKKEDFTKNGLQYDLILDAKTNRPISAYTRSLAPNGRYVTIGGDMGKLFNALVLKKWIMLRQKKQIHIVSIKPNKDLAYMNELFEKGKVKAIIDGPYSMGEFHKAFDLFAKGDHKGKVVIRM